MNGKHPSIVRRHGSTSRRPTPSMVVALTALVFAMGGTGYAASELTKGGPTAKSATKKKKPRRGPAGPQGAPGNPGPTGTPGAPGAAGAAGSPGAASYIGKIKSLNTAIGDAWAFPTGVSTAGTLADARTISPNVDLALKDFTVDVTSVPGGSALRFFYITINGNDGVPCLILSNAGSCTIKPNAPMPALSLIEIHSEVAGPMGTTANPADALFSWVAG